MALHKLLQLLLHFKETVYSLTMGQEQTTSSVHLMALESGPPLMDSQNPAVNHVHGCIIDGNVISKATYHDLGIIEWEP